MGYDQHHDQRVQWSSASLMIIIYGGSVDVRVAGEGWVETDAADDREGGKEGEKEKGESRQVMHKPNDISIF